MMIVRLMYQLPHGVDRGYGHSTVLFDGGHPVDMESLRKHVEDLIQKGIDFSVTWRTSET